MALPRSAIGHVKRFELTIDPPNILGFRHTILTYTVKGLRAHYPVKIWCEDPLLGAGLSVWNCWCPAKDTLKVEMTNHTSSAVDGAARVWKGVQW